MLNNEDHGETQTGKLLDYADKIRANANAKTYDYNMRFADFDALEGQSNESIDLILNKIQKSEEARIHFTANLFQKFIARQKLGMDLHDKLD